MVVGVCQIAFSLPGNDSLKGKRSVVRRIVDRTRARFNVAVAEVAALDEHRRTVIGFSVVSNDTRHVNSMLDHITTYMAAQTEAVVLTRSLEILHVDGEPSPLPEALRGSELQAAPDTDED